LIDARMHRIDATVGQNFSVMLFFFQKVA